MDTKPETKSQKQHKREKIQKSKLGLYYIEPVKLVELVKRS